MKNNSCVFVFSLLLLVLFLSGCQSASRYHLRHDKAPKNPPDLSKVENAKPKYEPYSRQGNKPYTVFNKDYSVLPSAKDFIEFGKASYYGAKFHGYHTSNGEIYDMYSMSGAHKSLPLPSYVKVTNLDNNKTVIVRVNDRGPFHQGRVIDLSYAAAYKLGMLKNGVANVKVEAIHFDAATQSLENSTDSTGITKQHYIQLVASKDKLKLRSIAKKLRAKYQINSRIQAIDDYFRLQLGPIKQNILAEKLLLKLRSQEYPKSYIVVE
ncbi:MAG: septal ring lytic transglycosylase RlpA family protein [Parashewanella sp.]